MNQVNTEQCLRTEENEGVNDTLEDAHKLDIDSAKTNESNTKKEENEEGRKKGWHDP